MEERKIKLCIHIINEFEFINLNKCLKLQKKNYETKKITNETCVTL